MEENKRFKAMCNGREIASNIKIADEFMSRLIGLMFIEDIKDGDGLLIKTCNSIHSFFMKFSIDVIFLSNDYEVVKVIENMTPWKVSWMYFKAAQVLELRAGTISGFIKKGDRVELVCIN